MLVMSRKRSERIRIAENIWVQIVEIRGNKVRLGVVAPKAVPVRREELLPQEERYEAVRDNGQSPATA